MHDKGLIPLVVYILFSVGDSNSRDLSQPILTHLITLRQNLDRNGKKLRNAIIIIIWHSLTKEQKENYKYVK